MNVLDRVEAACAQVVEGTFARIFPTPLAPVQVARRLATLCEDGRARGDAGERFVVRVHPRDAAAFGDERYLVERWNAMIAEIRGGGRVRSSVDVVEDSAIARGTFAVDVVAGDPVAPALELAVRRGLPAAATLTFADDCERTIGRDAACNLVLVDPRVSRRHAAVRRDGPELVVRDLASTNGTFVNDALVESARLRAGDVLRAGDSELVVRAA